MPALIGLLLVSLTLVATPTPAHAQAWMTIRSEGDQQDGRWQTFDLQGATSFDIVTWWDGDADVNIFIKDANNNTIASSNGTGSKPEWIRYNGSARPDKLAILVSSGSASYRAYVHEYGTAPWLEANGTPSDNPPPPNPPPPDNPPPSDDFVQSYPGMPAAGTVLFGASQEGNEDPWNRLERATGVRLGVRRTFFRWDQRTGYMIRIAREDISAGRVPWMSVKPPDWRDMANGRYDGQIDEMLRELDALNGPVWLTVHHEPEGGGGVNSPDGAGGPSAHLGMNRRIRQRMNALGVDNVALAPILMAWSWDSRSGRNPNEWWDPAVYDFMGIDTYDKDGNGVFSSYWYEARDWAGRKGVDIAVAEYGIRGSNGTSAQNLTDWHAAAYRSNADGRGARVVAIAYYDNLHNNWRMQGELLSTFRQLVDHPRNAHP